MFSPQTGPAEMWHPTKLALGAVIAAGFVAYYVALETSCANMSQRNDGGELVITSGGTTDGTQAGVRLSAPRFAWSGAMPLNGTADAKLLRIDNLCDDVLDCSSCPAQLRSTSNASALDGALLIYNQLADERLFLCGFNRLARVLGRTGLVSIALGLEVGTSYTPGGTPRLFRLGEHRDALPRDGDGGTLPPVVEATQYAFNPILDAFDNDGKQIAQ